jgi:small conductance mechanosensitive channel
MDLLDDLSTKLADGRLGANLIAVHGIVTVTVLVSLILRRIVSRGSSRLARWTGQRWLETAGEEAARRVRMLLFWLTLAAIGLCLVGGLGYHLAGRDVRADLDAWYQQFTVGELFNAALRCAAVLAIVAAAWLTVRMIRRIRPLLEKEITTLVGHAASDQEPRDPENRGFWGKAGGEEFVHRWFNLLQWYLLSGIRLLMLWAIGRTVGLDEFSGTVFGFLLRVLSIVVIARLLTLSCRVLSQALEGVGDRYLGQGPFRHYWERVARLFPFGERCFEAAVYVTAASLCVGELHFIAKVAEFGPRVVRCIGIFFVTRVLIELFQVLLGEAFGLYSEEEAVDQKGRTLVPLLCSILQYVLYFGSALVMLKVFEVDTTPILAGASIVGLAVGLGAQNLVSDVVSGFFILFEGQYLVGDYVQIGDATGTVEAVGIRVTQLRDGQGKVYIIPNGQVKGVVSYSKGYVHAVVDYKVPTGSDLEGLIRAMAEAGHRLRQAHHEVLAETRIHGLVELTTSDMTVRAVTKVRPGTHATMQNEYRRLLKEVLDQNASAPAPPALAA